MRTLPRNLRDHNNLLYFRQSYMGARENLRAMKSHLDSDNEYVYTIMQQFDNSLRRKFEDFLGWQGATKMPSFAVLDRPVLAKKKRQFMKSKSSTATAESKNLSNCRNASHIHNRKLKCMNTKSKQPSWPAEWYAHQINQNQ